MPRGEHAAPLMGTRESISDSPLESQASPSVKSVSFTERGFCKQQRNAIRAREKTWRLYRVRVVYARDNYARVSPFNAANRASLRPVVISCRNVSYRRKASVECVFEARKKRPFARNIPAAFVVWSLEFYRGLSRWRDFRGDFVCLLARDARWPYLGKDASAESHSASQGNPLVIFYAEKISAGSRKTRSALRFALRIIYEVGRSTV